MHDYRFQFYKEPLILNLTKNRFQLYKPIPYCLDIYFLLSRICFGRFNICSQWKDTQWCILVFIVRSSRSSLTLVFTPSSPRTLSFPFLHFSVRSTLPFLYLNNFFMSHIGFNYFQNQSISMKNMHQLRPET